uniref:Uncharacterized protein n=2 Tax=Kalanchoe fedtschenkoi TaxID=63787 RepID=A0A7N0UXW8_KALFE
MKNGRPMACSDYLPNAARDKIEGDKKDTGTESISSLPYHKLYSFADSKDYALMSVGSVAAVANGFCMPIMTILFGKLIDGIGKNPSDVRRQVQAVCEVALHMVYFALATGVLSFFQVSCWMVTGERQAARIRSLYLKALLRQDIGFFDTETSTGEVVGRMSGDTVLLQDAMGEKVGRFIQMLATFVGGFIVAFYQGWYLTAFLLCSVPPIIFTGAVMMILITKLSGQGQTAYSQASTVVEQTISSIRTVGSFTGERHAIALYNKALAKAYKFGVQEGLAAGLGFGSLTCTLFCSYGFAVWFGAKVIAERHYTAGRVMNVMLAVLTGSLSVAQASPCLTAIAAGRAAAFKMFEAIKRKPVIDAYNSRGLVPIEMHGDIELRDVCFSYPSRPHEWVFENLSTSIPSGTTAALVGQSGSGKSTVINLIERFYDPQHGEVLIDGVNIKRFQLKWLRENIGLVSQEPVLFASSIGENIAYGKDSANSDEIRVAMELANAARFIDKLPQGLDTMVGEHGVQLSGGQKQRIAIARAILKDPKILLLDEATSALDAESERIVQAALDKIMINRTTLTVAHRLTTVRNADVIAVIQEGKIIEKGSHTELLRNPRGVYTHTVQVQQVSGANNQTMQSPKIRSRWGKYAASRRHYLPSYSSPHLLLSPYNISFHHSHVETVLVNSASPSALELPPEVSSAYGPMLRHNLQQTVPIDTDSSSVMKPPPEVPLSRLAHLNKPEILILILGSMFSVVNGIILPEFGRIISNVIKAYYLQQYKLSNSIDKWALMFVFLGLASLVGVPGGAYFFSVAGCKLIQRIRSLCFQRVVYMEIGWFDDPNHSSGAIGARLAADAASIRGLVGDSLALLVQNTAAVITGLTIAFSANWQLALIILFLLPLLAFSQFIQIRFLTGFSSNSKAMYEEASQVASDAVSSIRTVASFHAQKKVMQLYNKKCEGPVKAGKRRGIISGLGFGLSSFLLFFVYAVSFYSGAQLVNKGKTEFENVFRVFFALSMTTLGISQSSFLAPDISKAKIAAASVFAMVDRKSLIDASDKTGVIIKHMKGSVKFDKVNFNYPSRPDIQVLRDICLTIDSGKTVALVGESGSGKSTIISLLLRFYDPNSGSIKVDNFDIKTLNLKWLRQQMGLVSQEPVLFNDSVRVNIAYGKGGRATEAEVLAAAQLANAHTFISALQQGYDTMVGERGIQLSGGQKQRVAMARALVNAPKILLLDEATSALDSESERIVQEALDKAIVNRTTVVVAHRLSTIKGADRIVVIKNGVIAEQGRHEALLRIRNGVYASLVRMHASSAALH